MNEPPEKVHFIHTIFHMILGLGFRPMANDTEASSIIWFSQKNKQSWINSMEDFLNSEYASSNAPTLRIRQGSMKN